MKHKSSHQFMTKMLSYQGIFVLLPYIIIKVFNLANNPLSEENQWGFIIYFLSLFAVAILFDFVGLKSKFLDVHSRKITLILCYIGAVLLTVLSYLTFNEWDNSNLHVLIIVGAIFGVYLLIGWFYIRSEKTNHPSKEDKPLRSSAHCFVFSGVTWGCGYFINETAIIVCSVILLLIYPVVILIGDKKLTEEEDNIISPEKLAVREDLFAVTDFTIDIVKVIFLLATVIILSYNGEIVLLPTLGPLNPALYWRNLMWLSLSCALTAFLFEQMEYMIYGKFLVTLVFGSALLQGVFALLGYKDQWLIFTILNGVTLSGVFTFIEQKIAKSGNVRVLPGLMFYLILIIQGFALLLNQLRGIYEGLDIARIVLSIGGLLYIYYRISIESKQPDLKHPNVRFSPLGIKYVSIPETERENNKKP